MKKLYLFLICALCALNAFAQLTGADEISKVVIHERPADDAHTMGCGTNFRGYGPTLTSGTAKFFGLRMFYDGNEYRYANLRFALYNMEKEIVELYKPMRVYLWPDGINGFVIPCQVNAPAGDYYVVPMFRWDEDPENEWTVFDYSIFHPDNDIDGHYQNLWKFSVIEDKLPLIRKLAKPEGLYHYNTGDRFDLTLKMTNPYDNPLSGRIKIMHERNIQKFSPGCSYNPEQSTQECFDCMTTIASIDGIESDKDGAFNISLSANEKKDIIIKDMYTDRNLGYYDQFAGILNCYYLPDGVEDKEENWIMLQEDCSSLFDGEDLLFTEINQDYWDTVTIFSNECSNYEGFLIDPLQTEIESVYNNSISLYYINGHAIVRGLKPGQEVIVMSITGKLITSKRSESENVSISLAGVPSGVYVATITENDEVIASHKFVK